MTRRKVIFSYADSQPNPADPYLMEAFNFTEYDLHFNQHGDLSEQQFYRLQKRRRVIIYTLLGISLMPLGVWYRFAQEISQTQQEIGSVITVLFFYVPLIWVTLAMWRRYLLDIYDKPVTTITDVIEINAHDSRLPYMKIADVRFKLNKKQWLALKNREAYTIYFTSNTKIVLSIKHEAISYDAFT